MLGALTSALLLQNIVAVAAEEKTDEAPQDGDASATEQQAGTPNENYISRTEKEVLDTMQLVAENDKLSLYFAFDIRYEVDDDGEITESGKDTELFALINKESGYVWWSTPVNSEADTASTPTQRKELQSGLVITVGDPTARSTSTVRSGQKCSVKSKEISNGIKLTYSFTSAGIKIPVSYTLEEDYLKIRLENSEITEDKLDAEKVQFLTELKFSPAFGAGASNEDGFFIIPDGSGAVIEFNNGKTVAKDYSQYVYSTEITSVPTTKPSLTKNVSLPMYGIVKGSDALMVVAAAGDANAKLNCQIGMATKSTSYNVANFSFTLRGTDTYYLSGIQPLTVFESGQIKSEAVELRYYPIYDKNGVDYVDVASKFRGYLEKDCGVKKKATADSTKLCLDIYGGTQATHSVLGFPVQMSTAITSYEQTKEILSKLSDNGVDNMLLAYNDWTEAAIDNEVDYKAKPSSTLGGKSALNELIDFAKSHNTEFYPVVNNVLFTSGQGYWTFTDTTVRVSGEYARQLFYNTAYGIRDKQKSSVSILSPSNFKEIYGELVDNYSKYGFKGASIGELNSVLYGDYSKKAVSREETMKTLVEAAKNIDEKLGTFLGNNSNCYFLPYTDYVTNIPLSSQ